MLRFVLLFGVIILVFLASLSLAGIPKMINYQGMLTDNSGSPLTDTVDITFIIYDDPGPTGGNIKWDEIQYDVPVINGLFNVILGSENPINLDFDQDYWLDVTVEGEHMPDRLRFTSVGYAYRALVADSALVTTPGSGSNWSVTDSVLYTTKYWGIARGGAGNKLYGNQAHTMVNLGVACTTGTSGENYSHSTVSGGYGNIAAEGATAGGGRYNSATGLNSTVGGGYANTVTVGGLQSTVGGGMWNTASSGDATVSGGDHNTASGYYATVCGGSGNKARGYCSVVAGGGGDPLSEEADSNVAQGDYSVVAGGRANLAGGKYSFSAGRRAKALHSGSFVWADTTDADFNSTGDNSFNVRATGGSYFTSNNTSYGARFENSGNGDGIRVYGECSAGLVNWGAIWAYNNGTSPAVYAYNAGGGKAAYFAGAVEVTGYLTKGGGGFKIDHPLEPENKYLYHSFVESPDMMNIYNGNVVLDGNGEAWVELPEWFESLNRDFRYQLTPIGAPGPNLYIAQEIAGNRFQVAGGTPGMKVSWMVTGIRHDPFAEKNRIPVEEEKPLEESGKYLHPEAYDMPKTMGINYSEKEKGD